MCESTSLRKGAASFFMDLRKKDTTYKDSAPTLVEEVSGALWI